MTNQETIQLLSAVIALVAVVVSPLVTLRVAKRQIDSAQAAATRQIESAQSVANLQARANVLSKNRQEWINTLRLEIAAFISDVTMVAPLVLTKEDLIEMHKLLAQVQLHLARTKLLINPNEPDHAALVKKMDEMASNTLAFTTLPSSTSELVSMAQTILKREWERVKAFT